MLVDRHVVLDLGALANYAETMVEKEALADLCTGMDVDPGEKAREMIDQAREEKDPALPQPVGDAM